MNTVLTDSDKHHAKSHLQKLGPFIGTICRSPFVAKASSQKPVAAGAKLTHWIRHGQGFHNLIADLYREHGVDGSPYMNAALQDPPLTAIGRHQAEALCTHAEALLPGLVVVSPLARATKTALIAFDHLVGKVPFLAHELCREISGVNSCDQRRRVTEMAKDFPAIDYSLLESDADDFFQPDRRETQEELAKRGYQFLAWLRTREEAEVAIGTHSAFLFSLLNAAVVMEEADGTGLAAWFAAGEMRSLWIWFEDVTA
eukprot:CAMPEP_0119319626 /NCGR_PEP_ID=MMETSP1333-20130426/49900_1 /TAXON_ID=418940 /ORGANISM="Scyphosphaera apsteinii, Strain RCC1455" /LENGTH=256 /DNA_ID=CAMNT_0007326081 /DNA_START=16 /DNA_END=786 /DNA_ORIENTATION=-